jgi:hypothetical protein
VQSSELRPEVNWITLCPERHFAKMGVPFFENKWLAASFEEFGITVKHRSCSARGINGESIFRFGRESRWSQAARVDRVGHTGDLIEIIDAPDQPAFLVAPSAKIFHVQIPNC